MNEVKDTSSSISENTADWELVPQEEEEEEEEKSAKREKEKEGLSSEKVEWVSTIILSPTSTSASDTIEVSNATSSPPQLVLKEQTSSSLSPSLFLPPPPPPPLFPPLSPSLTPIPSSPSPFTSSSLSPSPFPFPPPSLPPFPIPPPFSLSPFPPRTSLSPSSFPPPLSPSPIPPPIPPSLSPPPPPPFPPLSSSPSPSLSPSPPERIPISISTRPLLGDGGEVKDEGLVGRWWKRLVRHSSFSLTTLAMALLLIGYRWMRMRTANKRLGLQLCEKDQKIRQLLDQLAKVKHSLSNKGKAIPVTKVTSRT